MFNPGVIPRLVHRVQIAVTVQSTDTHMITECEGKKKLNNSVQSNKC